VDDGQPDACAEQALADRRYQTSIAQGLRWQAEGNRDPREPRSDHAQPSGGTGQSHRHQKRIAQNPRRCPSKLPLAHAISER